MFDKVYRIAIESNDFEELKRKLKKLHIEAVAIKDGIFVTTGAQLAREGRNDKVEWMRQIGANVNAIASGYALAGNDERVKAYLRQHRANVDDIACGYAQAGNHERVEAYRKEHGISVDVIVLGYARAGNDERVEAYRTQHRASVDAIAYGYALSGNDKRVEVYRTQHRASVDNIALGYARAGNHERVEAYRTQHRASVNAIALGYARAGNDERVEFYRTQHDANVNDIAYGYALAENHERVEFYRTQHDASVDEIAYGYARTGNHEKQKKYDIHYLLDSYLKERAAVVDSSGSTKEYFHGSFFSIFQKSFTQKREAVTALKSALSGEHVDLSEHLSTLRNGNLGKELRAFVKSGMGNALVGKNVNTVSDFVQALQDKNSNQQQNRIS